MSISRRLIAYSDAAARGNPGPAGAGVLLADEHGKPIKRIARYLGRMTNNQAEYAALLMALEAALAARPEHLELRLDSELVVRQLEGRYRVRNAQLQPLYERAKALLARLPSFSIRHVPRSLNREADALANGAIDEAAGRQIDKS